MKRIQKNATIIIDVFRAFTTASYVLARSPAHYIITTKSEVVSKLAAKYANPLLIGKPERNVNLIYTIPNSPTRTKEVSIENRMVFHRTEAGAKGIMLALESETSSVFAVGFVNVDATINYIKSCKIDNIELMPMGHEATTPTLEDEICARYILALWNDEKIDLENFLVSIRQETGKYFLSEDQQQYPREDLENCLELNRFDFAIRATANGDHAVLTRHDVKLSSSSLLAQKQLNR